MQFVFGFMHDATMQYQTEERLRQSEEFYRAMFEKNLAVKLLIDPESGTIVDANQAACTFYGYPLATLRTLPIYAINILPPEQVYQRMQQATTEQCKYFEFRHRLHSGEIRDVEVYSSPIVVQDRTLLFSIVHDITTRKRTEQSLRVQYELTNTLSAINNLPDGLSLVLETVLQLEGIDCGGVYLVNRQHGSFNLIAHRGLSEAFLASAAYIDANSPQTELVRRGTPIYQTYATFGFVCDERHQEGLRGIAVIPILHQHEIIAVLNLGSHSCDEIPLHTRELLEAIAAQIGGTIVRINTETTLHESQHNLQTLFNSLDDLLFITQLDGKLIHVNPAVEQRLGYTRDELLRMYVLDMHPPEQHNKAMAVFAAMVEGRENTCMIPLKTKAGQLIPVETRIVVGMWNGQQVIFGISRDITERRLAEVQLQRANERLLQGNERLRQRNQDMLLLNQLGNRLQECTDVREAYEAIAYSAARLFAGQSGVLYIRRDATTLFDAVAGWGDPLPAEPTIEQHNCRALREQQVTLFSRTNGVQCERIHDCATAALCVPLIVQGEALGIFYLHNGAVAEREARQRWQQLAETVTHQVGLALNNLTLREQLRQQALHDPLTGLYNRRYLDETLPRELQRAVRQHQPVGVIMVDMDHFKHFNDTYGHDAGDTLLRAVGSFLQRNIRGADIACRYGGEEFTLVLPGASLEDTRRRAEEIRSGVQTIAVQHQGHMLDAVTASLGVAIFPNHSDTADGVIKAADQALYQAKRGGRDQVVVSFRL